MKKILSFVVAMFICTALVCSLSFGSLASADSSAAVLSEAESEDSSGGIVSFWFVCTVATFIAWGMADLFYKKGAAPDDKYSSIKTSCIVGLVMGIHAAGYIIYMTLTGDAGFIEIISQIPIAMIKYLPVSSMYILSMTLGYVGLRYIELSVSSPIQNSSGAVTAILLVLFGIIFQKKAFFDILSGVELVGIVLVCLGVFGLSLIESRQDREERALSGELVDKKYRTGLLAIMFPILYCIVDGLGTFADGLYLDEFELLSEDIALVAYELTFFVCAVVIFVYLKCVKKESFKPLKEKNMILAALFETAGQFFYVFAMSGRAVVAAPVIASYCVFSVLLSRIFLKEKLSFKQYAVILIVFAGILLMGIAEGIAE